MYDSDLSNEEWAIVEHHFNPKDQRGNAHKHPKKLIVDAILYVVKRVSLGGYFLTTFLHGKPFTVTLAAGIKMALGRLY